MVCDRNNNDIGNMMDVLSYKQRVNNTTIIAIFILSGLIMFRYLLGDLDNAIIGGCIVLYLVRQKLLLSIPKGVYYWIIYILIVLLLGLLRENDKLDVIRTVGLLSVFLGIGLLFANDRRNWQYYIKSFFLFFGAIHCIGVILETISPALDYMILEYIGVVNQIPERAYYKYKGGLTGEAGLAGFYAAIFTCIVFVEIFRTKRKAKYNIVWGIIGFLSLLLTGKRMLFMASFFAILFFIYIYYVKILNRKKKILNYILMFMFLLPIMLFIPALQSSLRRILNLGLSSRGTIWGPLWESFKTNPLVGLGAETVKKKVTLAWGTEITAHNEYLRVLAEDGILGFSFFIIAIFFPFISMIKIIIYHRSNLRRVILGEFGCKDDIYDLLLSIVWQMVIIFYAFTGNPFSTKEQTISYFVLLALGTKSINSLKDTLSMGRASKKNENE